MKQSLDGATDEELVDMVRTAGDYDPRPFEALMRRHQAFVAANCRAITRQPNDVDDLAQEVFVKAYFGLGRFAQRSPFRGWLHRIKVNHCLNHLRKAKGKVLVDMDDAGVEASVAMQVPATAETALQSAADREQIFDVLDAMPDTLRVPLMLRDGDGFSYEEIASHLEITLPAAKMRIKRGREQFRQRFSSLTHGSVPAPEAEAR